MNYIYCLINICILKFYDTDFFNVISRVNKLLGHTGYKTDHFKRLSSGYRNCKCHESRL